MRQNPQLKLKIIGHTDNIGNSQLNYTLAEFRAKITKAYLLRWGIQEGRITPIAAGASHPTAFNDTEENRRKNRRATLLFH